MAAGEFPRRAAGRFPQDRGHLQSHRPGARPSSPGDTRTFDVVDSAGPHGRVYKAHVWQKMWLGTDLIFVPLICICGATDAAEILLHCDKEGGGGRPLHRLRWAPACLRMGRGGRDPPR